MRKVLKKVDHKGRVYTWVPSGMATPGPPLGSQLGQIGVNVANFVKDFNLKTSINKVGLVWTETMEMAPSFNFSLRRACRFRAR